MKRPILQSKVILAAAPALDAAGAMLVVVVVVQRLSLSLNPSL